MYYIQINNLYFALMKLNTPLTYYNLKYVSGETNLTSISSKQSQLFLIDYIENLIREIKYREL